LTCSFIYANLQTRFRTDDRGCDEEDRRKEVPLLEALSYVVLVLLSLVGYSGGATGRSGKRTDLKPIVIDLVLIAFIWTAALYSRLTYDFNRWLLILVWVGISVFVGIVAVSFRRIPRSAEFEQEDREEIPHAFVKRIWHRWTGFSKRMGSFQSRVMLSFFFFIVVSPAALMIKMLADPLRIKKKQELETYWVAKTPSSTELDDYRRQF
jgi:hypothetical protein